MMESSLICLVMNLTLISQMVSPDSQDVTFKMFHSFCIFYDIVLLIVIVSWATCINVFKYFLLTATCMKSWSISKLFYIFQVFLINCHLYIVGLNNECPYLGFFLFSIIDFLVLCSMFFFSPWSELPFEDAAEITASGNLPLNAFLSEVYLLSCCYPV